MKWDCHCHCCRTALQSAWPLIPLLKFFPYISSFDLGWVVETHLIHLQKILHHHLSCCLMAMCWAFSYLKARIKSLGIRLNSCLWFHCRILSACCTQHHSRKRKETHLHHLKTPATSTSPASSRGPWLHHKNWQKWRNLHLDYFLETFSSWLLGLSLVASSVCVCAWRGRERSSSKTDIPQTHLLYVLM